jgi:hypothetical protein
MRIIFNFQDIDMMPNMPNMIYDIYYWHLPTLWAPIHEASIYFFSEMTAAFLAFIHCAWQIGSGISLFARNKVRLANQGIALEEW